MVVKCLVHNCHFINQITFCLLFSFLSSALFSIFHSSFLPSLPLFSPLLFSSSPPLCSSLIHSTSVPSLPSSSFLPHFSPLFTSSFPLLLSSCSYSVPFSQSEADPEDGPHPRGGACLGPVRLPGPAVISRLPNNNRPPPRSDFSLAPLPPLPSSCYVLFCLVLLYCAPLSQSATP